MKKYKIVKPIKYIKDGMEKTFWSEVGTMAEFEKKDGSISRVVRIPAIGLEAQVFPIEEKAVPYNPKPKEEEINIKDVPF